VKKWILGVLALLLLAGAGAVGAYLLHLRSESRDVRGSSTEEFVETLEPPPATAPEIPGITWPNYGYNEERLRTVDYAHRPPYRIAWRFGARNLVEFPPAIAYGRLYFTNNTGVVYAVNGKTGKRAWKYASGRCTAASPAVSNHVVFVVFLNRLPCDRAQDEKRRDRLTGEVVAFAAGFGRIRWRREIGPSESSPLVVDGLVYVSDWRGVVYALDEKTGKTRWTFRTKDEIKAGVAVSGKRLYIGSYDHNLYALNRRTGKLLWKAAAQKRIGRRGTFYSTPAAAYGRVFVGSTDRKVYSFGAATGKLIWSQSTRGFVYSSPAVWRKRVYAGSYDKHLYCFDAATGDILWKFKANGAISGSPTVIDGVVYFATLKEKTFALDARTGRRIWSFPDGKYTPVVADPERVYLVGHARIYGMVEK
jgi:outer membrane protein assembly factor BamB